MDVIATIWKDPYYADRNARMIEAGVDFFRVKCSHGSPEEISCALEKVREQIDNSNHSVQLLADLPEAKIRLGNFPEAVIDPGTCWNFRFSTHSKFVADFIPINSSLLIPKVGKTFFVGDGEIAFKVHAISSDSFTAMALNGGTLIRHRSLASSSFLDQLNHVTPFIDDMISLLPKSTPDVVAFSFVNSRSMLDELKNKLYAVTSPSWQPKIIAKIESRGGVANVDEILEGCDGIMIARGDLALNTPYQELGVIKKKLTQKAHKKEKYCIVSTGVLGSMLHRILPERSDILDVTNACFDGASAIMLCKETAHNEYPERAVTAAKQIIQSVTTYDSHCSR